MHSFPGQSLAYLVVAAVASGAEPVALTTTAEGLVEVGCQGDTYRLHSQYSHPAQLYEGLPPGFHFNGLTDAQHRHPFQEAEWRVTGGGDGAAETVTAQGAYYRVQRRITVDQAMGRVDVTDRIVNLTDDDLGLAVEYTLDLGRPVQRWWIAGIEQSASRHRTEDNPTAFLVHERSGVGTVASDDVLRNQLHQEIDPLRGTLTLATRNLGISRGGSHDLAFSLFLQASQDYFDFLNALRRHWQVNFTMDGPVGFFPFIREPWLSLKGKPDAINRYFERKHLKILLVCPWYLYDDGYLLDAGQYKALVQENLAELRQVRPELKFVGNLEPSIQWVPISVFGDTLPPSYGFGRDQGHRLKAAPPAASAALDRTVWADSLWRDPQGLAVLNTSDYPDRGPGWPKVHEVVGLQLYPTLTNHRFRQFNEQIDALLHEVGLDGVYFDLFNYCGDITYERWDGHTVTLDQEGRIARRYALISLLSAEACASWARRILDQGKIVVTNLKPVLSRTQRLPALGFNEAWSGFDNRGPIPDAPDAARCQLASPLALGVLNNVDSNDYARSVMRCVMAYLRYGVLYVHYYTEIPETGPGSGDYGVLNHLFPITPVELHKGWVKGTERVIGCVSLDTTWDCPRAPVVLGFDDVGRKVTWGEQVKVTDLGGGHWRIRADIADWQQFVVVE